MKELFKSLAEFQQECPTIAKATAGYNYKYADLPSIMEIINPLMKKHKLGFTQPLRYTDGVRKVATIIFHTETGNSIESEVDIPVVEFKGMNDYQSLGSGITYLRRYTLSSALGIVTDEDTDGAGDQKPKSEPEVELPWMSKKQCEDACRRIQEAKPNVHIKEDDNDLELTLDEFMDKLKATFRIRREFKEALKHDIDFQKTLNESPDKPQTEEPTLI